jgi:hypothetical protein
VAPLLTVLAALALVAAGGNACAPNLPDDSAQLNSTDVGRLTFDDDGDLDQGDDIRPPRPNPSATPTIPLAAKISGLTWSMEGYPLGRNCIEFSETRENQLVWANNFLCTAGGTNYGWVWSESGAISGMKCTRIFEHFDQAAGWDNNHLCFPASTDYDVRWAASELEKTNIANLGTHDCVKINETKKPYSPVNLNSVWNDNYLCWKR